MNKTNCIRRFFLGLVLVLLITGCTETLNQKITGEHIDDAAITSKIKSEILNDPILKSFRIDVESTEGVVQLTGSVDSMQASVMAMEMAIAVKGVKSVNNGLVVK